MNPKIGKWVATLVAVALCVPIASSIAAVSSASADGPGPTLAPQQPPPTPDGSRRPEQPPVEALNCVRPTSQNQRPELDATGLLQATIDQASRDVVLSISRVPGSATCYSVFRNPSGTNPVLFAYTAGPISAPVPTLDPFGIPSAGRYCYSLIFGSTVGSSAPFEICIDVPATMAPLPTPTPAFTPPPQPHVGPPDTGTAGPGNSFGRGLFPLGIAVFGIAALGAAGYGTFVRRRSPR